MEKKTAKYITVLDFEIGRVFQYKIEEWDIDNESCEEFLTRVGHNLSNCEWMVHDTKEIVDQTNRELQTKYDCNWII